MITATDITEEIVDGLALTQEELSELERAGLAHNLCEYCPENTPERATKLKRVNPARRSAI